MEVSDIAEIPDDAEPSDVGLIAASASLPPMPGGVFRSAVRDIDDKTFEEQREGAREVAVAKLVIESSHCLMASITGWQILSLGNLDEQVVGAPTILSAVVGVKSPATLMKRANSLLAFLRWVSRN